MHTSFEVAIVGGGPSGLSAALILGRARRRVVVCDAGRPCNAAAPTSHGLLSRDGTPPGELLQHGWADLHKYGVQKIEQAATGGQAEPNGVALTLADGATIQARKAILAPGMVDQLPPLPGLSAMWGHTAFRCPYCHAFEFRDQPLGILANGNKAFELCMLLPSWSKDLILFTGAPSTLDTHQRYLIEKNRIPIREDPVIGLEGKGSQLEKIVLADGTTVARRALVVCFPQMPASDLPIRMGLVQNGVLQIDQHGQTTQPNVFVAGDLANQTPPQFLASALYHGARVADHVNHVLAFEDFQKGS